MLWFIAGRDGRFFRRDCMTGKVLDAIDRLRGLRTNAARWLAARAIMADMGGDWMTLGSAHPDRPTALAVLSSTPDALMQDYIGQNLQQVDPWMGYSASNTRPLDLDPGTGAAPGGPAIDARLPRLFSDHGLRHVLLVPGVPGHRTRALVLCASHRDSAQALRSPDRRALIATLGAVVTACVHPEDATGDEPQHYDIGPVLTPRERETLLWLATGLRTAGIAHKMGVENVTVSLHLASARRKLGARTREQALVIALRHGLIAP
jgi:DNA-binding CsgD family transcriptional regulator